jgi:CMP-N-acetylneuraminic acid synthetase
VEALFPEHVFSRSQDLEEAYHDAGQFYWGRAQAYLEGVVAFFCPGIWCRTSTRWKTGAGRS